jgi:hypothetical protein
LNSRLCTFTAGTVMLESHFQSVFFSILKYVNKEEYTIEMYMT